MKQIEDVFSLKRHDRFGRLFFLSLLIFLLLACNSCARRPTETVHGIAFTSLGIPSEGLYEEGSIAHSPWDMVFYDGVLYVGNGDYDANTGPATVYSYNARRNKWKNSTSLPEEEINRFLLLDGVLATPGIDPTEDWTLGNYYTLEDGVWQKHRVIPHGIHTFDIVYYHGALFAGLGVEPGKYPVVRSEDGESFLEISFEKEGLAVDTTRGTLVRTYDLIVFQDTLYATLVLGDDAPLYELYRFDEEKNAFVFESDLSQSISRVKYNHMRITSKVCFDDRMLLVTGKLYETKDMESFREIKLEGETLIADLYEHEGALYLLTASKNKEGKFKTSVWQAREGDTLGFTELFNFLYDAPPLSLAVDGNDFYIGMGDTKTQNEKNGTVLLVKYVQ